MKATGVHGGSLRYCIIKAEKEFGFWRKTGLG